MTPLEAASSHKQSLPFKVDHIEKLTSARYVGPGVISEDTDAADKTLSKRSVETDDKSLCTQRYGCLNCTWVRVCAPTSDDTLVEVSRRACPASRPYCDAKTGSCVVETSPQCKNYTSKSNVTCFKKEGYFPHPTDCSKFIYCYNYTSYLFECTENNYYNPYSHSCNIYYYCYTADCTGNDGRKVGHPLSLTYYTYCLDGTPVGFDRCLEGDYLNSTSQLCEPICENEGLRRDASDCTKYYKCSYVWMGSYNYLVKTHLDCQPGYSFKPEEFQCVEGVPETGCIQSY